MEKLNHLLTEFIYTESLVIMQESVDIVLYWLLTPVEEAEMKA